MAPHAAHAESNATPLSARESSEPSAFAPTDATAGGSARIIGVGIILAVFSCRAVSSLSLLPGWDMDPMVIPYTPNGLGPAGSLLCDAVAILAAVALLWPRAGNSARGSTLQLLAVLVGAVPVAYHGWFKQGATIGDQRIGAAWLSAILCALAIRRAASDVRVRALVIATLVGLAALMTCKGLVQVLVENPATIADFRANQDQYLTAQGFTPDSPMARAYIRRVESNDPTVWMGLTNIFATFAAMGLAIAAALLLGAVRSTSPRRSILLIVGLLAAAALCGAGVAIAGSKGGFVVGVLGLALAVGGVAAASLSRVQRLAAGLRRFAPALGITLVAAALTAVVVRGMVGERVGELSLFFRWFYMKAAAVIGASHALGVGPDGFKDAYLLVKDPLSPEEVASPHSLLLDWWSCLGWLGVAWVGLWLFWLARASGFLAASANADSPGSTAAGATARETASPASSGRDARDARVLIRAIAGVAVAATIGALWTERFAIAPETAAVRVGGLAVWITLGAAAAIAALRAPAWVGRLALAAPAVVGAVHSQIEMSGTWVQSAGLLVVALGAASATPSSARAVWPRWAAAVHRVGLACVVLASGAICVWAIGAKYATDTLEHAAVRLRPVAELAADPHLGEASPPRATQVALQKLVQEWLPGEAPWSDADIQVTFSRVRGRAALASSNDIMFALFAGPSGGDAVCRESSRLSLEAAAHFARAGVDPAAAVPLVLLPAPSAKEIRMRSMTPPELRPVQPSFVVVPLENAVSMAGRRTHVFRPRAEAFNWLAVVHQSAADMLAGRPEATDHLVAAESALRGAMALDPTNPLHVHRLLRIQERLGRPAADLAATAGLLLQLDDNQRLDRSVRGLQEAERRRVEAIAAAPLP